MTILTRLEDIGHFLRTAGKNSFRAFKTTIGSSFIGKVAGKISVKFTNIVNRFLDLFPKSREVLRLEGELRKRGLKVPGGPVPISRKNSISSEISNAIDL